MKHPQYDEVAFMLQLFNDKGFTPKSLDDGDGELQPISSVEDMIDGITSVDYSNVYLSNGTNSITLFIVLGNEPGVLISDYGCPNEVNHVVDEILDALEERYND